LFYIILFFIATSYYYRYLADGESANSLACGYRVGKSTVHDIIDETTEAMWDLLRHTYLEPPTKEQYKDIARDYFLKWNLPNCVGSIDGKHIAIMCPPNTGSVNFNYKKYFSIVLLAVCDANYNFIHVDIGSPGSASDGGILRDSYIGQMLYNNRLSLPDPEVLPNTPCDSTKFNFYIVGDEAFPLRTNLMRPFSRNNLDIGTHKVFNYRLSRARRVIENCFGILAARWRILHTKIKTEQNKAENIVKACVVLHNYVQKTTEYTNGRNDFRPANDEDPNTVIDMGNLEDWYIRSNRNAGNEAFTMRENLATYLTSPAGSVHWQEARVYRGVF
jgi:hypothetical protein